MVILCSFMICVNTWSLEKCSLQCLLSLLCIIFSHTDNHFLKESGPSKHQEVAEQEQLSDCNVSINEYAMC